ncbi:hypothetical protein L1987_61979 [Smallanthus sonchifolius]|uniref:Uncharacterized protein n=1 Tax=Smallanthus sonchifolius TaxID=185202 RepID=A0ACB9C936_9ASTR|nr:hypothetical protein L1987_61979 [Smallanthus sonchifolius]
MENDEQTVLPVFYDVDPSDVRKQKRKYEEAFSKHEGGNKHKVESWRKALEKAGNISGWVTNDFANGHEAKCIKDIVDKVSSRLRQLPSTNVNKDLFGIETRLQDLKSMLETGSGGVRVVGIWGVGGGGKTTLASVVYKEISHLFEAHCFLQNIREESSKHGLETLQEKFLSVVLKTKVNLLSEIERTDMIKSRLCHKSVLVVLDDVDDLKQLEALAGSHDWFGEHHDNPEKWSRIWEEEDVVKLCDMGAVASSMVKLSLHKYSLYMLLMMFGNALEDRFMSLILPPQKPLVSGPTTGSFTLQLPHNWYRDFSGFWFNIDYICPLNCTIVIKHEMSSTDSQPDKDLWEEFDKNSESYEYRKVAYVPFASLMHIPWWNNSRYSKKNILFQIYGMWNPKVGLVPRKISKTGDSIDQRAIDCSEFGDEEYEDTKTFEIKDDSKSSNSIQIEWCH